MFSQKNSILKKDVKDMQRDLRDNVLYAEEESHSTNIALETIKWKRKKRQKFWISENIRQKCEPFAHLHSIICEIPINARDKTEIN